LVTLALDTNVFVDLVRGKRTRVQERYIEAVLVSTPLVASVIVHHEMQFGVFASRVPEVAALNVAAVMQDIIIEPLTEDDVNVAARVRAALKQLGTPIGSYDLLIAGQALARGWTLVTANVGEFSRVEGLELQDWSQP
jgi:tRNA(fMet)-specific endonuclease VapC